MTDSKKYILKLIFGWGTFSLSIIMCALAIWPVSFAIIGIISLFYLVEILEKNELKQNKTRL